MIRPDYYIFGYRCVTLEQEDKKEVIQAFLKNGISVQFHGNSFFVKEYKYKKIKELLGTRVDFSVSECMGFAGFLYRNRMRFGIMCALLFTLFMTVFSSLFVWDVRIEGCGSGQEENIIRELSEAGLSVGSVWHSTDKSKIEVELLSCSEYVSWVNINRRGNVAYVKVIDKITPEEPEIKRGYSNIVASRDGIIDEITVVRGVALVKAGDTVKAGQLLISGVLPAESGGGFCYAEGSVIARTNDTLKVEISREASQKVKKSRKISTASIDILSFRINIFKSYRNFNKEYDIIEKTDKISLFGKKLPLSLTRRYAEFYSMEQFLLSHEQMTEKATLEMQAALAERTEHATILRIKTDGNFTDFGYVLVSDVTVSENIARDLAFDAPSEMKK